MACIDPHQTGFVGKGGDRLQLIKFWPSRAPCGGAKFFGSALLQPARRFCVSLSAFFHYKCIKAFFGYKRFDSVTYMLCDPSLPSFDSVILNSKYCFKIQCRMTNNALVSRFLLLDLY